MALDLAALTAPPKVHQGPHCGVYRVMRVLNPRDQAVVTQALASEVTSRELCDRFAQQSVAISESTIKAHRARRCCCYKHHEGGTGVD